MTLNSTSTQIDTQAFLAAKSSQYSLPTQAQTQMDPQYISVAPNHGDNTSFIGTNQESKSEAAYISSPITTQSPLATHQQMVCTGDTNDSEISTDTESEVCIHSLTIAEANKKKSVRSRFNVLKNSKRRSKPEKNCPPADFIFLPSSSTPIKNSVPPLEKRHCTSSIKSTQRHSQEKHNTKAHSSRQKKKHDIDPLSTHSSQMVTLRTEEKHLNPSCKTRHESLTFTTDCIESTYLGVDDAEPSTPTSSRFLAAFQKIRQQRTSLDHTISPTRRSVDVIPVGPTASTIASGSKSTSFTEKIKNRFKPTPGPAPTTTTRKPPQPELPRPSHSTTPSIINRSWSQLSRPFASSSSIKNASFHPPHQSKLEGQSMNGKRTPSTHRHHQRHKPSSQQHHAIGASTPRLNGFGNITMPLKPTLDRHHTTFGWDYGFDANAYTVREGTTTTMISSTCSTTSQRSSASSLSVTASSSTSASSSPTSLSTDLSHDTKRPLDLSNTNKLCSHRPIESAKSTLRSPIVLNIDKSLVQSTRINNNKIPSTSQKSFRSFSNGGINNNKQISKAPNSGRPLSTTKNKRHVRFVPTAKVQDTFSKHDYDRGSDPYAICTRLTAHLAQQIKDELNAFKLEEMLVHHQSRGNTQFFM